MILLDELEAFVPYNEQEERDKCLMLQTLARASEEGPQSVEALYGRADPAHLTASAWVVSPDRSLVLMAYHNVYDSWSWLGGHADGQRDLRAAALREVQEESGLTSARIANPQILSLEVLAVNGHQKQGRYVPSHLHLNVTYLVEADPHEQPRIKPDENSRIGWMTPQEALERSTEPWFVENVYRKLIAKSVR